MYIMIILAIRLKKNYYKICIYFIFSMIYIYNIYIFNGKSISHILFTLYIFNRKFSFLIYFCLFLIFIEWKFYKIVYF